MGPDDSVVIEVYGEGKTDVGHDSRPQPPTRGVVPILVHILCDRPDRMLVKCHGIPFLQQKGAGKGLWQKMRFARRQAMQSNSDGVVFVRDSEGDLRRRIGELEKGRDSGPSGVPMAIGVAHPCIEAWLLADAGAIQRAMQLDEAPEVVAHPEDLPAPWQDRNRNPKTELARVAGCGKSDLSARDKDAIAQNMSDLDLPRTRCPRGFAPFADEVHQQIRSLF